MGPGQRTLQAELKQSKPFASLAEETLLSVQRTAECIRREIQKVLKPFSITATQYNALRILRGAGAKGLTCSELGERLVSSDPDITRLLGRLAKLGFIQRRRDDEDGRVVLTAITGEGLRVLAELVPVLDASLVASCSHMEQARMGTLIDLLEELRAPYRGPL